MNIYVGVEAWLHELTSALDENEWLDSHPDRLILWKYETVPNQ